MNTFFKQLPSAFVNTFITFFFLAGTAVAGELPASDQIEPLIEKTGTVVAKAESILVDGVVQLDIRGEAAKFIFNRMLVPEINGHKSGENVHCWQPSPGDYLCDLGILPAGNVLTNDGRE